MMKNYLFIVLYFVFTCSVVAVDFVGRDVVVNKQIEFEKIEKYDQILKSINLRLENNGRIGFSSLVDSINSSLSASGYKIKVVASIDPESLSWWNRFWREYKIDQFDEYKALTSKQIRKKIEAMNCYEALREVGFLYSLDRTYYFKDTIVISNILVLEGSGRALK